MKTHYIAQSAVPGPHRPAFVASAPLPGRTLFPLPSLSSAVAGFCLLATTLAAPLSLAAGTTSARAADTPSAPAGQKKPVVVMTSYHDDVVAPFKAAFEAAHPDLVVEVSWQQGREALDALGKPDHGGADVFWGPSLNVFPALRERGLLQPLDVDRAALPGKIGGQPISDPAGHFEAFEVAGYGFALNEALLRERGIAPPKSWADGADARFAGLVAMPTSAAAGFAPALYDIVLQAEGWARGWAVLSEMSANAKAFQGGVMASVDVSEGTAAIGPTIDFYAFTAGNTGKPVGFVYPARTAFLPAQVAVLADAPHPQAAKAFAAFLLSRPAQERLPAPDIRRHPVRPDAYGKAPEGFGNPFAGARDDFVYDGPLGRKRRALNAALFDVAIAERHERVAALWAAIRAAEAALAKNPDAERAALVAQARALAGRVPVTAATASDGETLTKLGEEVDAAIRAEWAAAIDAAQDEARALLARADETSP